MIKRIKNAVAFRAKRLLGLDKTVDYHVLSHDPLILFTYNFPQHKQLIPLLTGRKLTLFLGSGCTWAAEDQIQEAHAVINRGKETGCFEAHYLANSDAEAELAAKGGIPTIVCSHNAFIDDQIFNIQPNVQKRYRAIYDARLTFFKRHELAAKVDQLALITYAIDLNDSPEYTARARELLKNAAWLNPVRNGRYLPLTAAEVSKVINESQVGLMLSAREGGNFASTQYLLCGVPVVSTRSIGGRESMFDAPHVEIVDDTPEAVAAGVEKLISLKLDPVQIRRRTIELAEVHRQRFIAAVQQVYDRAGVRRRFADEWKTVFTNKLMNTHPIPRLQRLLRA